MKAGSPAARHGRLSDLSTGSRADWSSYRNEIRKLEPGEYIEFSCPAGTPLGSFRSNLLIMGNRIHTGPQWRVSTRSTPSSVILFLAPRTP